MQIAHRAPTHAEDQPTVPLHELLECRLFVLLGEPRQERAVVQHSERIRQTNTSRHERCLPSKPLPISCPPNTSGAQKNRRDLTPQPPSLLGKGEQRQNLTPRPPSLRGKGE